jgi:hypothetical protein
VDPVVRCGLYYLPSPFWLASENNVSAALSSALRNTGTFHHEEMLPTVWYKLQTASLKDHTFYRRVTNTLNTPILSALAERLYEYLGPRHFVSRKGFELKVLFIFSNDLLCFCYNFIPSLFTHHAQVIIVWTVHWLLMSFKPGDCCYNWMLPKSNYLSTVGLRLGRRNSVVLWEAEY